MKKITPYITLAVCTTLVFLIPELAFAAGPTCTNAPQFALNNPPPAGTGLISTLVQTIQNLLNPVAAAMYTGVEGGASTALAAAATLYIAIYGLMFAVGMVPATIYDFIIRMTKVSIIGLLVTGGSWGFFNATVVPFFQQTTTDLINVVTSISVGGAGTGAPFSALDNIIYYAVSAKMFITLMGVFTTGPYGPLIGLLLLMSLGSFLKALMNAMWVYIMSLVLQTLLFGLAPIFIGCLLFSRTRHIFDGWLNQLINASLQPVLLFTFFGFFAMLILSCIQQVLGIDLCWTQLTDGVRGSPFSTWFWRFMLNGSVFDGGWGWTGPDSAPGPVFPIDIMIPLTFYIIADLTGRFGHVAIEIAKDLAGAATDLRMGFENMGDWFSSSDKGTEAAKGAAGGNRFTPGRGMGGGFGTPGGGAGGGGISRPGTGGGVGAPGGPSPVKPGAGFGGGVGGMGGGAGGGTNPFAPGASSGVRK